jgi:CHASE1-domain containing sensor protein
MIIITIALLGSIAASDFANDYNHGVDRAHERQAERELDRIDRQIERLEHVLKGAQAERDFWSSGVGSIDGGGGNVDGRRDSRR